MQIDEVAVAILCDPAARAKVKAAGEDPDRLVDLYIDAINQAVKGRPKGMTVGVHVCRGNYKGMYLSEGGYDSVAEKFFSRTDVDHFLLEFDTPRAGGFAPLRFVPKDKGVVLGLVSSKTPQLEKIDLLKKRAEEAAQIHGRREASPSARNAASPAPWAAIRSPRPMSARSSGSASMPHGQSGADEGPGRRRGPGRPLLLVSVQEEKSATANCASSSRTPPTRPSASAWCSPTARSSSCAATTPQTYDAITPQMEVWTDLTVVHRGTPVVIDGIGFAAIGRLKFLQLLQEQAGERRASGRSTRRRFHPRKT